MTKLRWNLFPLRGGIGNSRAIMKKPINIAKIGRTGALTMSVTKMASCFAGLWGKTIISAHDDFGRRGGNALESSGVTKSAVDEVPEEFAVD